MGLNLVRIGCGVEVRIGCGVLLQCSYSPSISLSSSTSLSPPLSSPPSPLSSSPPLSSPRLSIIPGSSWNSEEVPDFDAIASIKLLVRHTEGLLRIALFQEQGHALIRHAAAAFYEVVSTNLWVWLGHARLNNYKEPTKSPCRHICAR